MLKFPQNGMCSFIFHHPTYSHKHPNNPHQRSLYFNQFSPPYFTSIRAHKIFPIIPTKTLFLYTLFIFHFPIFILGHLYNPHQKVFLIPQSFSQFRLIQGPSEQCSDKDACDQHCKLSAQPSPKPSTYHCFHALLSPSQEMLLPYYKI